MMTLIERFEKKFIRLGPDECWEWLAYRLPGGYGQFCVKIGEMRLSHRVSFVVYRHEIPSGQQVLHRCDNPSCVNPSHLFLGSIKDNMADKISKGRANVSRGSRQHKSKLTEAVILSIRSDFSKKTKTRAEIAKENNVALCTVCRIIKHKTWRHVGMSNHE